MHFRYALIPISGALALGCAPAPTDAPGAAPLLAFREPPALERAAHRVEVSLVAGPSRLPLVGTAPADLYTYNGSYPGPTLELLEGDHVVVHFKNALSEPTNIHWHGLHVPPDQDGLPMDLVAPGAGKDYVFDIPPGSAGTYWYHPHPHGLAAMQVARGLFGAIRVRAADDPVPAAFGDTLVVLSDNRFAADGSVAPDTQDDKMNGREGDRFFVNGLSSPTLTLRPGETRRLRLVNASAGHYYNLAAPGATLTQIGTDGGLFGSPVPLTTLLLAPGERAEVLLKASQVTQLQDLPYDRGATAGTRRSLLAIAIDPSQPAPQATLPATLRQVPALDPGTEVAHTITFTEDHLNLDFLINGRKFDPARTDLRSKLGATEAWKVVNDGDMDHPFHLHGFQFQLLDRNGVPEPRRTWKDTVNLKQGEAVRLAVKLTDFPGLRVFHCHILEHEDLGMMGTLRVE